MEQKKLRNLVLLALFIALIFLLGQTPLGLIPLGWCNVTLLVIPVAVGTLYMGLKNGLILGLAFGATSFLSALMRPSKMRTPSTMPQMSITMAPMPQVMTFVPRLCVPLVIYELNKVLSRRWSKLGPVIACACGSLTNTVLYLGSMYLFYNALGINSEAVLTAIVATAGGAGPCEAIAAGLIAPPIAAALRKIKR